MITPNIELPIGVFDSGVGGLTVLRALYDLLPQESFLYLGDTARVPYGIKSPETITRYAEQAAATLIKRGIKLLVIACNTVTAVCLKHLQETYPHLPIIGVVEPGAKAAIKASQTGHIAVIGTEATVNAQSYQRAIKQLRTDTNIIAQSCGLLVALAEEGWTDDTIAEATVRRYLEPILHSPLNGSVDCLVLGCTHYPAFLPVIKNVVGDRMHIVDSAKTTAEMTSELMQLNNLAMSKEHADLPRMTFLVTDSPIRFSRTAKQFLGWEIPDSSITMIDF